MKEKDSNTRIYGIDPGCIKKPEEFDTMSEVDLYLIIDAMSTYILNHKLNMAHGKIPEVDLTEHEYALKFMIYQTNRFGTELSDPQINQHINPTPSYDSWFEFYNNHFKNILTDQQWNAFLKARKNNQDISAFMPTGSWKYTLDKKTTKCL